jgi:hypothetical protein
MALELEAVPESTKEASKTSLFIKIHKCHSKAIIGQAPRLPKHARRRGRQTPPRP